VRGPAAQRRLHLTFDDGPHPGCTPQLLDVLATCNAKATFFLLGDNVQAHPGIVERMVKEGHVIANHSMSHPDFRKLGSRAQLDEVDRADALLARFDGQSRHLFRPPRGHATLTTILASIWRAQPLVLWNVDSFDFRLPESELQARLEAYQPQAGDILLFHDDMASTVAVLRRMLPRWRQAGFEFSAI
jgi:peptidoglycan/xylan/chitin deacetylase (PgdA/CDA1 family)